MELFRLMGRILVDSSEANESLDKTEKKAEGTGGTLGKLGGAAMKMGGLLAAGATAGGAALSALMGKTMETANEINKFSQVTGMSAKGFQEWDHVAKSVGYTMEQASGDLAALAERAMDAASGVGENAEMFKMLGVSVMDSNGQLKTQEQLFNETIAGLQSMEDVTKRNAIATAMLSTTGEELAPILNMSNAELQKMKANANVISDDDLNKAAEFKKRWDAGKNTLASVAMTIGLNLMPIFTKTHDWIQEKMPVIQATGEKAFNAIKGVAMGVYNFFKDNLLPIFTGYYNWIQEKMPVIKATASKVFDEIKNAASRFWAFAKENLLPIISSFYGLIQEKMPQIQSVTERVFGVISKVVSILWGNFNNYLIPVLKALWDFIEPTFPLIGKTISTAMDIVIGAVDGVITVFEKVVSAIEKAVDWLNIWNDKPAKKKTVEVEERRTYSGVAGDVPNHYVGTTFQKASLALMGNSKPVAAVKQVVEKIAFKFEKGLQTT